MMNQGGYINPKLIVISIDEHEFFPPLNLTSYEYGQTTNHEEFMIVDTIKMCWTEEELYSRIAGGEGLSIKQAA